MNFEHILNRITEIIIDYGPRLLAAIAVWLIGTWVVRGLTKTFIKTMERREVDASLRPFLQGTVNTLLKIMLVLSVLATMGIEMTSFVAVLGAIGLAVGMALSGTLQNFAGGVMILLFKPFKVGDYIKAQGYGGTVKEIQIFNTILKTPDNVTVVIPNGGLSNSSLTNYSAEARRRVDWTFGIGYGDSAAKAEEVIKRLCDEDPRILKDPEVFIALSELADSSVNFVVRAWVEAGDYWAVFFEMNRKVYDTFEKEGLNIPFPQMDVHVHGN
ncbi:mechanosensitive ion channel [Marinilongibacter aquaticus]|uniref:mechanosensitive ion channel family protein n=1 Tax=Marinilongibacter aquaticus TaxID=2975157 RepID=UPI0021BD74FA|nr:mechanosensitive ion channel domain-containing protein [Marinilongibacter aquaticus]UBM59675.1 mechanosensitive ion channel [Marinilongibacter aquaticus]